MKRLHIHLSVTNLQESIDFYSTLFNHSPTVEHKDYAKWNIHEPALNFAISQSEHASGINHLGIQVDSDNELNDIALRLNEANITTSSQKKASCCYAQSNKHWTLDPQGIAWEAFHSFDSIPVFGSDTKSGLEDKHSACCTPNAACC